MKINKIILKIFLLIIGMLFINGCENKFDIDKTFNNSYGYTSLKLKADSLTNIIKNGNGEIKLHLERGFDYLLLYHYKSAYDDFIFVKKKDKNNMDAKIGMVMYYQGIGNYNKSRILLDSLLAQNYKKYIVYYLRSKTKEKLGQAIKDLDSAIILNKNFLKAYQYKAMLLFLNDSLSTSLDVINNAISLDPNITENYTTRVMIYEKQKNYNRILDDYKIIEKLDSSLRLSLLYEKIKIYKEMDDTLNEIKCRKLIKEFEKLDKSNN